MADDRLNKASIIALSCIIFILMITCAFLAIKSVRMAKNHLKIDSTIYITDTLRMTDTIIQKKTQFVEVLRYDTVEKFITDTDTVFIQVPIEKYSYKDTIETDTSRVEIGIDYEGYKAKIDSVGITYDFHPTIDIFVPEKPKHWKQSITLGIQAGYGIGFGSDGRFRTEPYLGLGLTYGFGFTW